MSKFENLLNTLWEDYTQPNATPAGMPVSNGTPSTAPAPTANNNISGAPNPANVGNTTNQQQPKPGVPNPTNKPVTDPNHPAINDLVNAKNSQDVLKALQKNNLQLTSTANK
jgi:hypothetical protein